jgi:hypothetical protein
MAYVNPEPKIDDIDTDLEEAVVSDYTRMDEVYFAFIDVLGFKKTFDDIRISKKEDVADKYRDVFNYYFELMGEARFMERGESTGCYAGQTSDSLYFYTDRSDFLVEFMKIFSHFNLYAMSNNVFFRGGIAKGNLYKKEKYQFYGNSVIYAYLMESVISKYPIIVIDEKTNEDMKNIDEYNTMVDYKNGRYYIKPFVFLNEDVALDIVNPIKREIHIDKIKHYIEDNRSLFEYDAKNYEKYVFLQKELKSAIKE